MKKEEMERLWGELAGGVDGIYQRYAKAKSLREQEYQAQKQQAKAEYEKEQNRLNGAAKIRQLNTNATLHGQGLGNSGESLHAQLMNDYTHSMASAQAAESYGDSTKELALAKSKADAQSEAEMAKEMADLSKSLYNLGLEEKKLDQQEAQSLRELEQREKESLRETQLKESQQDKELAWEQRQWEEKNALAKEELEEDKRQFDKEQERLAQEEREAYEEEIRKLQEQLKQEGEDDGGGVTEEKGGTVPDKSAQSLYKEILYAAQTQNAALAGTNQSEYHAKVKEFVTAKLKKLIADEDLDGDYRKSLAIYGMLGGYLD